MNHFEELVALVKKHAVTTHPSTMIAQAMLESGLKPGSQQASGLALKYNNWFGIKASSLWKGKVTPPLQTREEDAAKQSYQV